ncbi:MAG: major capsid protein [Microviridae sp.]|nr:MAG: major capsid protein [Microviridae sp.]
MPKVTIGGNRLGSGGKNDVSLHNFYRSTHDLSYLWRSTISAGTLVPFLCEVALPGDTFDINLNCDVKTHPTIGPLFGSYKVQLDVFAVPVRLYVANLHMNMLGIGMKMNTVVLPQVKVRADNNLDLARPIDNQQVNPSSLLSYLGIRGCGLEDSPSNYVERKFNAIPLLAYWSIYKQYYANKMEGKGVAIHNPSVTVPFTLTQAKTTFPSATIPIAEGGTAIAIDFNTETVLEISTNGLTSASNPLTLTLMATNGESQIPYYLKNIFRKMDVYVESQRVVFSEPILSIHSKIELYDYVFDAYEPAAINDIPPVLQEFDLTKIDDMRLEILRATGPIVIDQNSLEPYKWPLENNGDHPFYGSLTKTQEGLGVKTYQSDLFNNWLNTEWIDGANGISEITAVSTVGDKFTIDELNLAKKVYDMLNRIAVSGGSYDDWLTAVYAHDRQSGQEEPAYLGGLIKELVFQEVISNAQSQVGDNYEPLGNLAGKGTLSRKNKGGHVIAKVDEPSYIIGIISLTPRIDYSQGNKWDTNIKTMDDFHKPNLDAIGYQDLITDQLAWFDTAIVAGEPVFNSAGKQPAWINYMTNVNQVRGNFADQDQQMFMTLNRRYQHKVVGSLLRIKDMTTYIDPSKFNHIFADTRLDAQNFWTQIGVDITARRKMSAKVIPNL